MNIGSGLGGVGSLGSAGSLELELEESLRCGRFRLAYVLTGTKFDF